jgi:hypothetical protein
MAAPPATASKRALVGYAAPPLALPSAPLPPVLAAAADACAARAAGALAAIAESDPDAQVRACGGCILA